VCPHLTQETHDRLIASKGRKEGRPLTVGKCLGDVFGTDIRFNDLYVVGGGGGSGVLGAVLEDRHLGAGGRVGMEGGIERNKIFRLILQVYNFVFKVNFFFKEGQPGALGIRAGAAVPEADLGGMGDL
jgi:hypothetical protein